MCHRETALSFNISLHCTHLTFTTRCNIRGKIYRGARYILFSFDHCFCSLLWQTLTLLKTNSNFLHAIEMFDPNASLLLLCFQRATTTAWKICLKISKTISRRETGARLLRLTLAGNPTFARFAKAAQQQRECEKKVRTARLIRETLTIGYIGEQARGQGYSRGEIGNAKTKKKSKHRRRICREEKVSRGTISYSLDTRAARIQLIVHNEPTNDDAHVFPALSFRPRGSCFPPVCYIPLIVLDSIFRPGLHELHPGPGGFLSFSLVFSFSFCCPKKERER